MQSRYGLKVINFDGMHKYADVADRPPLNLNGKWQKCHNPNRDTVLCSNGWHGWCNFDAAITCLSCAGTPFEDRLLLVEIRDRIKFSYKTGPKKDQKFCGRQIRVVMEFDRIEYTRKIANITRYEKIRFRTFTRASIKKQFLKKFPGRHVLACMK